MLVWVRELILFVMNFYHIGGYRGWVGAKGHYSVNPLMRSL